MMPLHGDDAGRHRIRTTVGVPPKRFLSTAIKLFVREQLARGPFLAAFDAGIGDVRDIAGESDFADLIQVRDDELLDAIDREHELRRRVW